MPLVAVCVFAVALAACASISSAQTSPQQHASSASLSAGTSAPFPAAPSSAFTRATAPGRHAPAGRIDAIVVIAKGVYHNETKGPKLSQQIARIARDAILLKALSRGNLEVARAEANAQLRSALNHVAHVTRISVVRGSRVLVNATINSDGIYVVAPATRALTLQGRLLGTLLVSIQDVTGFVKLVHDLTGAQVLVRGASGHVRTSLRAAAHVRLPMSGIVTIARRSYLVRSFHEIAWGNEPLTVWILERA